MISFIEKFKKDFVLVGGTAISLQLWHRKSIDFDFFKPKCEKLNFTTISRELQKLKFPIQKWYFDDHQRHFVINHVNFTRFAYMFDIPTNCIKEHKSYRIPNLTHLGAMKLHALHKRAKRKDYADLYYLISELGLQKLLDQAKEIFSRDFNQKLAVAQLSYHDDVNFTEEIEWMPWRWKSKEEVFTWLKDYARERFNQQQ